MITKKIDIWKKESKNNNICIDDTFGNEYKGTKCPYCESRNICAVEQVQMDGPEGTQMVECHDCGRAWFDIVELKGWVSQVRHDILKEEDRNAKS